MDSNLEMKLQKQFPFMLQNRVKEERNAYRRFGCECGNGWYNLIYELCESITKKYQEYEMPIDIEVLQVKQKFAALRFYYKYMDTVSSIQAIDFIGNGISLRLNPSDSSDSKKQNLRKDIADIVRSYEKKSASVCEMCGGNGERKNISKKYYYVRTVCENCYKKYESS